MVNPPDAGNAAPPTCRNATEYSGVTKREIPDAFRVLAGDILDCRRCRRNSDVPGYYPKFGAGSLSRPHAFIVSKNPGEPDEREHGHCRSDGIDTILELSDEGILSWLEKIAGGGFASALRTSGLDWHRHVYVTQAVKCPYDRNPRLTFFEDAFYECRYHLNHELALLSPSHVITLGKDAYKAIGLALNAELPDVDVREWWKSERLEGIPANGSRLYPLFLTISQKKGVIADPLDLGRAFERVLAIIAQIEQVR